MLRGPPEAHCNDPLNTLRGVLNALRGAGTRAWTPGNTVAEMRGGDTRKSPGWDSLIRI